MVSLNAIHVIRILVTKFSNTERSLNKCDCICEEIKCVMNIGQKAAKVILLSHSKDNHYTLLLNIEVEKCGAEKSQDQ